MTTLKCLIFSALLCACSPISEINERINRLPYVSDAEQFGVADYWQTGAEMLANGKGDCEDYAAAKAYLLTQYGYKNMWFFIVFDKETGTYHALLFVGGVILDSNSNEITEDIPARYVPVFYKEY